MGQAEGRVCGGEACRAALALVLAIILMLSAFTAAASMLMACLAWRGTIAIGAGAASVRAGLFGVLAAASIAGLIWIRRSFAGNAGACPAAVGFGDAGSGIPPRISRLLPPVVCLVVLASVALPRLSAYPWIAPDEAHHLSVARNLAVFHVYGSGLPDKGFRWFDNYDSVGAPVIVPVAGALALAGADPVTPKTVAAGRAVMAVYFGLLFAAMYVLIAPVAGTGAAACGLIAMLAMPGSIYLARTLYGEAPALAWLALGLAVWCRPGRAVPGIAAGLCFGLAVLCKSIMVLSAFAFLGVLCFEMAVWRRMRVAEWIMPACGGVAVIVAWWTAQTLWHHDVTGAAGGTLAEYQHNLLFGIRCLAHTVPALLRQPFVWLAALLGLGAAAGVFLWPGALSVRGRCGEGTEYRYARSVAILFMVAVFYVYWWLFFTPGHILRYLWFSEAIGGLFAGAAAWKAVAAIPRVGVPSRVCLFLLAVLAMVPLGLGLAGTAKTVWMVDEMQDEYAVTSVVRDLPVPAVVCTNDKAMAWMLNLLARRRAAVVEPIGSGGVPGAWAVVKEDGNGYRVIPPLEMK